MINRRYSRIPVFFLFSAVGCVGFAVDSGLLALLTNFGNVQVYAARVVSLITAMTVTWILNRTLTFRHSRSIRTGAEYIHYLCVQFSGAAINYAVFTVCLLLSPGMAAHPVIAVAVGSLVAMTVNYFAMKRFVFRA